MVVMHLSDSTGGRGLTQRLTCLLTLLPHCIFDHLVPSYLDKFAFEAVTFVNPLFSHQQLVAVRNSKPPLFPMHYVKLSGERVYAMSWISSVLIFAIVILKDFCIVFQSGVTSSKINVAPIPSSSSISNHASVCSDFKHIYTAQMLALRFLCLL